MTGTAYIIALRAHRGQTRWDGSPYIVHPMRVAATVRRDGGTPEEVAAAYLHDVLEDTPTTAADLLAAGITARTVAIVEALTRHEGETYAEFIDRVATDPSAARIKRADLGDNLDGTTDSLRRRYTRALARLS